jgi:sulfate adenylyltransferase subunit 1 (EFTu-like GTPase family)
MYYINSISYATQNLVRNYVNYALFIDKLNQFDEITIIINVEWRYFLF